MPANVKLMYLPMRGRAEAVRIYLKYCNMTFEDDICDFDVFVHAKATGQLPFDQLPVLEIDGRKIAQTGSIMRLISRLARKDVADALQAAVADSAFEAAQEVPMAQIYVALNLMEKEQAMHTAAKFKNALPRYLANWSKILENTAFFHGPSAGYADFTVFCLLDIGMQFVPNMLQEWPRLRTWFAKVKALPDVAEYLSQRPPCRDVRKWRV